MSLRLSPASPGAALPLSMMHRACFPDEPWGSSAIGRILALHGAFSFVAWRGDDPVGFLLARDLSGEAEILSIGVMPEARRQGVAGALLDAAMLRAQRQNCGSLVLEVAVNNLAGRGLYSGFGFVQVGRRPHYYRQPGGAADALILRRTLNSSVNYRVEPD